MKTHKFNNEFMSLSQNYMTILDITYVKIKFKKKNAILQLDMISDSVY